jgi:transcription elongation factor Elf1
MNERRTNQEVAAMVQLECPWCAGAASFVEVPSEAGSGAVDCADCGVRVDLAPDPVVTELALAA